MESKIVKHICLNNHPVAVLRADSVPQKAICFKEGKWGCVVALIKVASQGKIAAAAKDTTVCMGGRAGLGFQGYEHGWIEYFLSTGNDKIPHSEFYKKTPELAKIFTDTIPKIEAPACLVFKPSASLIAGSWKWSRRQMAASLLRTHGKRLRREFEGATRI